MSTKEKEEKSIIFLTTQVAEGCIECRKCSRDCRYPKLFGLPGEQARAVDENRFELRQAFLCSLCGLCTEVCPQEIDPADKFLSLRNEAVNLSQPTAAETALAGNGTAGHGGTTRPEWNNFS